MSLALLIVAAVAVVVLVVVAVQWRSDQLALRQRERSFKAEGPYDWSER